MKFRLAALALAATVLPAGAAIAAPTAQLNRSAQAECLFGVSAAETGLAEQINALREKKGRSQLNLDQVLTAGAEVISLAQSTEGVGTVQKVRIRTRDQLLQDFASVGAIAMKQKNPERIWKHLTKNTYARSILLRKPFEHVGVSMEEFDGKSYAVLLFGSEVLTPLSC